MKFTTEQKRQLFRERMGIAEDTDQAHNAVGRYANKPYHRSSYYNASGNPQVAPAPEKILSITIYNAGTTVENAILFGKNAATVQSGANIIITSKTAPSIEAINNEVASKPAVLNSVLLQANTKAQTTQVWDLHSQNLYGGSTNDKFIPQMYLSPANQSETLIDAPLPTFTASGNNWMSIPVEPGNTITANFRIGPQVSLEGIANGTTVVE